jgi:outer membrane protein OmpA-like peptidoglycan-associated protein
MRFNVFHIIKLTLILLIGVLSVSVQAQKLNKNEIILLQRDSLDFKVNNLKINTTSNDFSPIPYKSGLLYLSTVLFSERSLSYNKVFWVPDSNQGLKKYVVSNKLKKLKRLNDEFTAPTSNDNDILFNYKKIYQSFDDNAVEKEFKKFTTSQVFDINDSLNLIVFAKESDHKIKGAKRWELWKGYIKNGGVVNKSKIRFVVKEADYLYPSISKDGNTLYFSSNVKNGEGGYDVYSIALNEKKKIHTPEPVKCVNTASDEIAPFVIENKIYFSSNRQEGFGKFDIFTTILNSICKVENLGYPINTNADDIGYKNIDNNIFLTSNRNGNFDIISYKYAPIEVGISGILKYQSDSSILPYHDILITDVDQAVDFAKIKTNNSAQFNFTAKPNRNYQITTSNEEELQEKIPFKINTLSNNLDLVFKLKGRSKQQIKDSVDLLLAKLEKMKLDSINAMNLNDKYIVYYDFNKSILNKGEIRVLDSLLSRLKSNSTTNIIIGAFTDCIGSYKYNYSLSKKRAEVVVNYLIKNGLDKSRIISNGYSKLYTISPCEYGYSKSLQKLNRRAEIVLNDKKSNWLELEKNRGKNYYSVYNSSTFKTLKTKPVIVVKKDTVIAPKPIIIPKKKDTVMPKPIIVVKKDTVIAPKTIFVPKKKDTVMSKSVIVVKKDTVIAPKPIIIPKKKDTVMPKPIIVVKKDTVIAPKTIIVPKKKDTVMPKPVIVVKKDTVIAPKPIIVPKKMDTVIAPKPIIIPKKKDTVIKPIIIPKKKDTVIKPIIIPKKKDTVIAPKPIIVPKKKDTVIAPKPVIVVKKDTIIKPVIVPKKKDTVIAPKPIIVPKKKDTIIKPIIVPKKKDTVIVPKPVVQIAAPSTYEDDEIGKEEILKALDSLAVLKREQERIITYLTLRINKKPINVFVSSDSVTIEIYDNAIHDKDSVSIIYNNRIIVDKQELKVNKPIKFKLLVDKNKKFNELIMVAENLGIDPPNTAVMFVTEKNGRRQQIMLSTDMQHNEVVYFIRIGKE